MSAVLNDKSRRKDSPARAAARTVEDLGATAPAEALFGITELCREFELSPRAIRFYEDKGLLAPRRVNGARVYTQRDRVRLSLIQRAKGLGSSLAEIKQFLDLYGSRGEGRTKQLQFTLERTSQAIEALEEKRAQIEATLAELRMINSAVRQQLAGLDKALQKP